MFNYPFGYFIVALAVASGLGTLAGVSDPIIRAESLSWALGAVLLACIAVLGQREELARTMQRKVAPRYGPLAIMGMVMAGALLALAPFGFEAPLGEADTVPLAYVTFAANLLAQLCFALLALLAYRQAVVWIAAGLRWLLGHFAFSSGLASSCTPWAVAFFPWLIVVAMTLADYLLAADRAVWTAIFAPALLGASYLQDISLRTVLSHLSLLGFLTLVISGEAGMGVAIAETVGGWSPIVFHGEPRANAMFVFAIVGVAMTLALALKRPLVSKPSEGVAPASLSIYPDSRTYVGEDGYLDRMSRLILQSDGGVIGVTGLRGAGKSALLGAVMDRFRRERCVVWTVAPVSYQSDDKLSFLMSISRALCQKAIDDAGSVLYGHRSETQRAIEEFIRSIRWPLAIGCLLIAAVYLLGGQFAGGAPLLGPPLSIPDRVQLRGEQLPVFGHSVRQLKAETLRQEIFDSEVNSGASETIAELRAANAATAVSTLVPAFEQARAAEVARLASLLAQIDGALPQEKAVVGDRHAITPIPGEAGFDLVAGRIDGFDQSVLVDRDAWLRSDTQLRIADTASVRFNDSGLLRVFGLNPLELHDPATSEVQKAFAFLQEEFERRIVGNRGSILNGPSPYGSDISAEFETRIGALAVLRGDPRLAPHLEGVSADLRRILRIDPGNATSQGLISPDWASLSLIAAFYDNVAVLKDSAAAPTERQAAFEALFLEPDRLRELRAVLARYVGILEGRTLGPAAADSTVAASGVFSLQNITARAGALPGVPYAWVLGALLVLCLLPEILRAINFVARGLLNFRLLVLMRACTEFMELLNYSEGREASAGFGFRGLTLAGKRTLAARNLTLQSLTDHYQGFVSLLLTFYNGKLIVIIDELDKMSDPLHVKSVLLELKGALFQRGCYYVISISEDAAAAFRNRMAEGRDIFESTFEDVLGIERMSSGAAQAMVHRRLADDQGSAVRIDDAAIGILRVFAGAIPREIVRHLRETVLAAADGRSVVPQMIGLDIFRSELLQWRDSLKGAPLPGTDLIRLIEITQEIETMLPASGAPWPDLSSGSASIGARLAECLAILDPKQSFMQEVYDFHAMETQSAENQERYRKLTEIQSCLRLMTMNELMRHVWRTGGLDAQPSEAAVTCLRAIMIQPSVAAWLLQELAVRVLCLDYPEGSAAPEASPTPSPLVVAGGRSANKGTEP
ncbi:hypothetical protein [Paracoccus ravus]|uniref:hypothetical protein n=1 Tax=Paracoccus ravus TaxID=2447760 RepID=UPI00106E4D8D|nr:hypothetical protein [Paracoccus ravus]